MSASLFSSSSSRVSLDYQLEKIRMVRHSRRRRPPSSPSPSETCIKGHRSSSCKHTDRPLFEIKKKGRPITQCEHCRELRKTKQVHVKCICEPKFDLAQQGVFPYIIFMVYGWLMNKVILYASLCSGLQPGFDRAAFPNGLPPALGTSVAFPNPADGTSSDSDHGGMQLLAWRHFPC